jgi:acetyl esterase/lipase
MPRTPPPSLVTLALLLTAALALAADPGPTHADVSFGPHPHQLLDIYLPKDGPKPYPVLIWYGGIWKPAKHPARPDYFGKAGIAVVAVETRTMTDATDDKVAVPVSYVLDDARRAVQFVRLNAAKWGLDPDRIAVGGGSQGALPALYVACSGEGADPKADDPVLRASTRVRGAAAFRSQPSIDPKRMQEWVPGVKWGAPALGCSFEQSLARRDELLPILTKWSPDHLLRPGTPPLYFENNWGLTRPESVGEMDYLVHSPAWSLGFQKLAREKGITCLVKYPDHPTEKYADIWDFLVQELKAP